jgi:hypothetical protein
MAGFFSFALAVYLTVQAYSVKEAFTRIGKSLSAGSTPTAKAFA